MVCSARSSKLGALDLELGETEGNSSEEGIGKKEASCHVNSNQIHVSL